MKQIKAIIFDWGGVLIDNPAPEFLKYCSKKLNVSESDLIKVYEQYQDLFECGKISENELWHRIAKLLNITTRPSNSLWTEAFQYVYKPKKKVFDLVELLHKNNYKTALLSNTELPAREYFFQQNYKMFSETIFSCKEGIRKPNQELYKIAVMKLQVKPSESIFIDDKIENILAAEKNGLCGIQFHNEDQLMSELEQVGVKFRF